LGGTPSRLCQLASSCLSRPLLAREEGSGFRRFGAACDVCLADCMDARLEPMERRVAPGQNDGHL
jgi:hypothetical protein